MKIFPAIDLYGGKAVRLYKGDYANMTVYSENPIEIARDFEGCGCTHIHMVGDDWQLSKGARLERMKARQWGIEELK